jgi:hypothetical protein
MSDLFITADPAKNTAGKPALLRYRTCIEGPSDPFTGIKAIGMFPDGERFTALMFTSPELLEDAGMDIEEIARNLVENMTPEDLAWEELSDGNR